MLDEGWRSFPLESSSFVAADVTLHRGESVKSSLAFVAPANSNQLYLVGRDFGYPPWVYLTIGSDRAPFHKRTLLRLLEHVVSASSLRADFHETCR